MRITRWFPLAAACLLAACAAAPATKSTGDESGHVQARVQELLKTYAANDQAGVTALLDSPFTMLGSQISEKIDTPAQLKALMSADFKQWGSARISNVRDMDVRVGKDLATAYFLMSFQAGDNPSMPVRVTTTWRKREGEWFLTQSANSILMGQ